MRLGLINRKNNIILFASYHLSPARQLATVCTCSKYDKVGCCVCVCDHLIAFGHCTTFDSITEQNRIINILIFEFIRNRKTNKLLTNTAGCNCPNESVNANANFFFRSL